MQKKNNNSNYIEPNNRVRNESTSLTQMLSLEATTATTKKDAETKITKPVETYLPRNYTDPI